MNYSVIGLGYGDEGKGSIVDFLCSTMKNPVVVKVSGGCQAAHRVVVDDRMFVFSQFGAGAFANAPTIIGPEFIWNPITMLLEYKALKELGGNVEISIHNHAPIVTHYHKALNRIRCNSNGFKNSCGIGIGVCREFYNDGIFLCKDNLSEKTLRVIRSRATSLLRKIPAPNLDLYDMFDVPVGQVYREIMDAFFNIPRSTPPIRDGVVFENSQGVLLDETWGDEHNTYSTVTDRLSKDFAHSLGIDRVINVGVVRSYLTRHGEGPFPPEKQFSYKDPFNGTGTYQGSFRTAEWNKNIYRKSRAIVKVDLLAVNHLDVADPPEFFGTPAIVGRGESRSCKSFN